MKAQEKKHAKKKISSDGMNRMKDLEFLLAKVLHHNKKSIKKTKKG
jgi:hypothetical protein